MNAFIASVGDGVVSGSFGILFFVVAAFLLVLSIMWMVLPFILISGMNSIEREVKGLREDISRMAANQANQQAEMNRVVVVSGKSMERHLQAVHQALVPEAYEELETF